MYSIVKFALLRCRDHPRIDPKARPEAREGQKMVDFLAAVCILEWVLVAVYGSSVSRDQLRTSAIDSGSGLLNIFSLLNLRSTDSSLTPEPPCREHYIHLAEVLSDKKANV